MAVFKKEQHNITYKAKDDNHSKVLFWSVSICIFPGQGGYLQHEKVPVRTRCSRTYLEQSQGYMRHPQVQHQCSYLDLFCLCQ